MVEGNEYELDPLLYDIYHSNKSWFYYKDH